ncbi:MAG: hypothetical protein A3F17_07490 [Gammaproteobacteria bacterium RIFCSPHIGHO2_12_FULL_41_15]|nr:MAG: hypothetical protein A3F17_07490 [Gammaproteobacteria bacterium RIFCSPHIGHO2_12_FULL_41_15]
MKTTEKNTLLGSRTNSNDTTYFWPIIMGVIGMGAGGTVTTILGITKDSSLPSNLGMTLLSMGMGALLGAFIGRLINVCCSQCREQNQDTYQELSGSLKFNL